MASERYSAFLCFRQIKAFFICGLEKIYTVSKKFNYTRGVCHLVWVIFKNTFLIWATMNEESLPYDDDSGSKLSRASTHLSKQVGQGISIQQGCSFWCFLWAVSFEFTDAVSPDMRLSFSGAVPVSEIKPESRDTEDCSTPYHEYTWRKLWLLACFSFYMDLHHKLSLLIFTQYLISISLSS